MKIIVSPAKSLDFDSRLPTQRATQPRFLEEAETLNKKLARITHGELSQLMGISPKLADLNYQRYKEFQTPFTKTNARPAVFAYSGDVYQGLDAYTLSKDQIDRLQNSLRIISGLYGLLRPLDLIQAYRLEMRIKLKIKGKKDLYEFWNKRLTESLAEELKKNEPLINLASKEYAQAIDFKALKGPVISPVFKDFKNGKLKIISFYAKKARGSMVRYIVEKKIDQVEDLKGFDYEGYGYSENDTKNEDEPVFVR